MKMTCREGCGACCIAPSISSPIPGMPHGKPAGIPCVQLLPDLRCAIFGQAERPKVCSGFAADADVCGDNRIEALNLLEMWEHETGSAPMIDAGQASVR